MAQGDHPVHVGILRHDLRRESLGDPMHHRGGAIHRRQHTHIVARGHLSVIAHDAQEPRLLGLGQQRSRHVVAPECVIAIELAEVGVVRMHIGTGGDVHRGKADTDVVFQDGLAGAQVARGDLVAGRHLAARDQRFAGYGHADAHGHARHHDVVRRMQADHWAFGPLSREIEHAYLM
ncbi:hypothetical protein D3C87_1446720 [compost metagenome]